LDGERTTRGIVVRLVAALGTPGATARPVVSRDSEAQARAGTSMMTDAERLRHAEALLHESTVDALKKTACLLVMIANGGEVAPEVSGVAARDLMKLIEAVTTAEKVADAFALAAARATESTNID